MQIAPWKPCTLTLVPRSRNQNRYHGTTGTAGTAASVSGLNWKICTVPTLIICNQSPLPFHKHDRIRVTQIYLNCDDIVLLFRPYFLAFLRTSIWPPAIVLRSSLWPFSWVSCNIDRKTVVVTFEHYLVNFNSGQCCSSQNFHHRTSYIYFFIAENKPGQAVQASREYHGVSNYIYALSYHSFSYFTMKICSTYTELGESSSLSQFLLQYESLSAQLLIVYSIQSWHILSVLLH